MIVRGNGSRVTEASFFQALLMVVELLNKGLSGICETSKLLMGYHVKLAVCRRLRRGGWISIVSGAFELDTQMSVFLMKYNIATTHLFHCVQAYLQFFYTHLDVVCFVTLFLGIFQLLFEVFQAFTIALCLRKMQQNSWSHSDQINTQVWVLSCFMFWMLWLDLLLE